MLMNETLTVLKGIVHGKTIELEQEPGLPEGQVVSVTVQPVAPEARTMAPGEGIRRSAGGWAEDAEELDEYLELVRQRRKISRHELEP
jgi:hypothetical protein